MDAPKVADALLDVSVGPNALLDARDTMGWFPGLGAKEESSSYSILGTQTEATSNPLASATQALNNAANTARRTVGIPVPEEEKTMEDQVCEMCPTMTFKQRLTALIACCVLGYLLEICGSLTLIGGPTAENIRKFCLLYVSGNLIAIMATCFWVGPKYMCKKMMKKSRRCATIFYLVTLVAVVVLALLKVALIFVLLMLSVELCAAIWYSASYLPKGRWCIVQCCKQSLFSPCPDVLNPVEASLPVV